MLSLEIPILLTEVRILAETKKIVPLSCIAGLIELSKLSRKQGIPIPTNKTQLLLSKYSKFIDKLRTNRRIYWLCIDWKILSGAKERYSKETCEKEIEYKKFRTRFIGE